MHFYCCSWWVDYCTICDDLTITNHIIDIDHRIEDAVPKMRILLQCTERGYLLLKEKHYGMKEPLGIFYTIMVGVLHGVP